MPRRSAASLTVPDPMPTTLCPSAEAPAEVRQVFMELVATVPRDHFKPADAPLLEQYSQSILLARRAYAELAAHGPVIDGKASAWLIVLEKSHRSSATLAGRLRLAPQMRESSRDVARRAKGPMPSIYETMRLDHEHR